MVISLYHIPLSVNLYPHADTLWVNIFCYSSETQAIRYKKYQIAVTILIKE